MIFINTIYSAYPLLKWHFEILFVVHIPMILLNIICNVSLIVLAFIRFPILHEKTGEQVSLNGSWSRAIFYYPTDKWWRITQDEVHVITNGKQQMRQIHDCKHVHFLTHCFVHASLRKGLLNYRFRAVSKGLLMLTFKRELFWSILQYCVKL